MNKFDKALIKKIKSLKQVEDGKTYWLEFGGQDADPLEISKLVNRLNDLLPKVKFMVCNVKIKENK